MLVSMKDNSILTSSQTIPHECCPRTFPELLKNSLLMMLMRANCRDEFSRGALLPYSAVVVVVTVLFDIW